MAEPGLFAAYVGTGQFVDWVSQVNLQYDHTFTRAEAEGNTEVLAALEEFDGPPVRDMAAYQQFRRVMSQYLASANQDFASQQLSGIWVAPRASFRAIWNALQGVIGSVEALTPELLSADVTELGMRMSVPFVIVQGQDDWITPTSLAVEYFERVSAPGKSVATIAGAGHYVFTTHQGQFVDALVSEVHPLLEQQ